MYRSTKDHDENDVVVPTKHFSTKDLDDMHLHIFSNIFSPQRLLGNELTNERRDFEHEMCPKIGNEILQTTEETNCDHQELSHEDGRRSRYSLNRMAMEEEISGVSEYCELSLSFATPARMMQRVEKGWPNSTDHDHDHDHDDNQSINSPSTSTDEFSSPDFHSGNNHINLDLTI